MIKDPNWQEADRLALSTEFPFWEEKFVICGGTNFINWLFFFLLSCFNCISPSSVVMSQYTFKGFPLFPGSIQYSPSPLESPESRMSLQEWAAVWEYQPFALIENKKRETKAKKSLEFEICWKLRLLQVGSTVSYRFLFRIFPQTKLSYTNIDNFVSFRHSHIEIRHWGIQSRDIPEKNEAGNTFVRVVPGVSTRNFMLEGGARLWAELELRFNMSFYTDMQ